MGRRSPVLSAPGPRYVWRGERVHLWLYCKTPTGVWWLSNPEQHTSVWCRLACPLLSALTHPCSSPHQLASGSPSVPQALCVLSITGISSGRPFLATFCALLPCLFAVIVPRLVLALHFSKSRIIFLVHNISAPRRWGFVQRPLSPLGPSLAPSQLL